MPTVSADIGQSGPAGFLDEPAHQRQMAPFGKADRIFVDEFVGVAEASSSAVKTPSRAASG